MSQPMIFKKMSDIMSDIGAIGKNQKNTAQGFKFRGIDDFVNALYPALTKHGVFMTPRGSMFNQELKTVIRGSGKEGVDKHVQIMMEYDFYAEDGSKVTVGPIPAEGLDSGDKATNKALSAALKYALIQTFSIPTEDMAEADLDSPTIGVSNEKSNTVGITSTTNVAPKTSESRTTGPVNNTTSPVNVPASVSTQNITNTGTTTAPVEAPKRGRPSFRKDTPTTPAPVKSGW